MQPENHLLSISPEKLALHELNEAIAHLKEWGWIEGQEKSIATIEEKLRLWLVAACLEKKALIRETHVAHSQGAEFVLSIRLQARRTPDRIVKSCFLEDLDNCLFNMRVAIAQIGGEDANSIQLQPV